jgi:hypothetical protein
MLFRWHEADVADMTADLILALNSPEQTLNSNFEAEPP